jgi:hypothetical protein
MSISVKFPAQEYTNVQVRRKNNEAYNEWINEIPEDWIEQFCKNGLIPFLSKYGYSVTYDLNTIIDYCKEWAFNHVKITTSGLTLKHCKYLKPNNTGGQEEKEWYEFKISCEDWSVFASLWATTGFLDDSDAGQSQKIEVSIFAWHLINLEVSPTHIKWLELNDILQQQDDIQNTYHTVIDESVPYGGDRRTA